MREKARAGVAMRSGEQILARRQVVVAWTRLRSNGWLCSTRTQGQIRALLIKHGRDWRKFGQAATDLRKIQSMCQAR